jgi:hypothetical protein
MYKFSLCKHFPKLLKHFIYAGCEPSYFDFSPIQKESEVDHMDAKWMQILVEILVDLKSRVAQNP